MGYQDTSKLVRSLIEPDILSPAFVYDETQILQVLNIIHGLRSNPGCKCLFSLKAFACAESLRLIAPNVDGFAVSSLFEAKLVHGVVREHGTIHLTTPGLRADEIDDLVDLSDYITCNSLSQWDRFRDIITGKAKCGLRVNPGVSFVKDDRYNPCRTHSKLGIQLGQLLAICEGSPERLDQASGIHFHSNCDSIDLKELLKTVQHLGTHLGKVLDRVEWINLGGGYLFDESISLEPLYEAVGFLRSKHNVEVFVEPGAAIVRQAGYIVASVVDVLSSDDKPVAILDTTVNHMPEIFEYQVVPEVLGHDKNGEFKYIIAGCTCLPGDIFGEYAFSEPLSIGSRVIFTEMGAYTLVKSHMFNGINLPAIYKLTENGKPVLIRRFTYNDFASRCGVDSYATV